MTVRVYEHDIEIIDGAGALLRRHPRSLVPGHFEMQASDRIFNPSRETARLLGKAAKLGPHCLALGRDVFQRLGRPGQKALYGVINLPRRYAKADIESAAQYVMTMSQPTYQAPSASWNVRLPRPSAVRTGPSCNKPALISATSRNTTSSSKPHSADWMIRAHQPVNRRR